MVLDPGRSDGRLPRAPQSGEPVLVTLLGRIALRPESGQVPIPGARARALVVALALRPGRYRAAATLIDAIWGDAPPRAPMNALHTQISRLRAVLPEGVLQVGPAGYRLAIRPGQVDLGAAAQLVREARQALAAGAVDTAQLALDRARALWSGDPGADLTPGPLADDLAGAAAEQAEALDDTERAVREAAGDLDTAIAVARGQVRARPRDEGRARTLMRLLATVGRDSEALDVFAELRATLGVELGADPGPAISDLHTAILRGRFVPPADSPAGARVVPAPDPPVAGPGVPAAVGVRAAPNPLLGRDADLADLARLLRVSRVTTVLGPGGAGKTRVAHTLAARTAGDLPVVLVELAPIRPGAAYAEAVVDIETAISAAMGLGEIRRERGLAPGPRPDARRRLYDALSARPMLLVLDNCEHLVDACASVVADLVGGCPQLTVLTTSRAPLEITAETVYPLAPLVVDPAGSPAIELFAARARAVRPSARLDSEVVARLCRTLDGLPLAIELAAARMRSMSVEEIEQRLDQRFALLRSGDRTSPERHRTLHAVIAWSWNLLEPAQQITLRRMCRFSGGFDLVAAEVVAGGPEVGEVASAIEGLVGQSLLTVIEDAPGDSTVPGVRYRMLETVREFGEQQLEAVGTEPDLVDTRMAQWAREFAVRTANRYRLGDELGPSLTVAAELDNLVAVLRRAETVGDRHTVYAVFPVVATWWMMQGAHLELLAWIPRVLALAPPADSAVEYAELETVGHLLTMVHLTFLANSLRDLAAVRLRVRALLRRESRMRAPFRFLGQLMSCPPDATRLARLLATGARSSDRQTRGIALVARANIWENMGRIHGSHRDAHAAAALFSDAELWSRGMVAQHLGALAGQTARYRESVRYYEEAAELLCQMRAFEESLEVHSFLAVSLAAAGESARARRELVVALGLAGAETVELDLIDDPAIRRNHRLSMVAAALAGIELVEGEVEAGLAHYRRALELLGWSDHEYTPGPGMLLMCSAALAAHTLYGRADAVTQLIPGLVEIALNRFGYVLDLPQVGALACALGSGLLLVDRRDPVGVELLALAPVVVPRQDFPVMGWERHHALWRARIGPQVWDAALAGIGVPRRITAGERIVELVRGVGARLPAPLARTGSGGTGPAATSGPAHIGPYGQWRENGDDYGGAHQ